METRKTPLLPETYYHIYNRGINGQTIFFEEMNYAYFLKKMGQYLSPFIDVYAYCLLKNHFHILVKTKSEAEIEKLTIIDSTSSPKSLLINQNTSTKLKTSSWYYSNAFSSLFKSYTQAINKRFNRTGGLFEEPFRRIHVNSDAYLSNLVWYIHYNPQKHKIIKDFREYPYSSFKSHLDHKATKLQRLQVLNWFGNPKEYIKYHNIQAGESKIEKFVIESD